MSEIPDIPRSLQELESLRVSVAASLPGQKGVVVEVCLSRPRKLNALGASFWRDFPLCMRILDTWAPCRCVLLTGEGAAFCSGIELQYAASLFQPTEAEPQEESGREVNSPAATLADPARRALHLRRVVAPLQEAISSVEHINKPVLAAISGPCIGAGVDLVSSCDVRLAAADALFSVREVQLAMAPDIGTLQRLPRIVRSGSWVREVCFSARFFSAQEAEREGFVSALYPDREALHKAAVALCLALAEMSPVALAATKQGLNFARGRPVSESLEQQLTVSAAMLQTLDIPLAVGMQMQQKERGSKRAQMPPFAGL
ncbi:delta(3,5)-Delta(2,4)-dienoyl-CoA isomerase, mitochondrial [Cyclospora cayetanensis]|uniref:Enoyl-hydratase isomerase family protein n=2 Tax=Cyclospora cayetanensis TaxID=88456 RepID=A0A1D3CY67_9EIME|nr:delta(3,5)-Delta(2,4)-dienoyl-CoA isomerase, mitochondrial [Cyclospora cayetanensis]OEH76138.1 enoyl- hydratase isomerase family protein [Cyclospora cayetanensis]